MSQNPATFMNSHHPLRPWHPSETGLRYSKQIYLDNNSTTAISDVAIEAIQKCWEAGLANPASQHQTGQSCSRTLNQASDSILQSLDAATERFPADRLLWTSCGTEANNLVLFGRCMDERGSIRPGNIVLSGIEHPSVSFAAQHLAAMGMDVRIADVDKNGIVSVAHLASLVNKSTLAVSVMLANNETGVIQPVQEIAELCRTNEVFCHTDAVQAVGKINVSFSELGVDALTFAPHKLHGPVGIAGLILKPTVQLQPRLWGGFQQEGLRPGTENVALAAGAAATLAWYLANKDSHREHLVRLRDQFETSLLEAIPDAVVIGGQANRLPQTSCIAFPGIDRQAFALAADVAGIACSTGSACASGSSDPSPVLQKMNLPTAWVNAALRFSFGLFNQLQDANEAAQRISLLHSKLRSRNGT
jgi:cysteine desulfurase